MLRLGRSVLTQVISSYSTSPVSQLHRLLSAAAPRISPNPSFAVEDYLVGTCGLTRAQALKASTKIAHVNSPTNPDAILAYLARLGLSRADIAAMVAKDPRFLCAGVDRTLDPIVRDLAGLGLSHSEITRLVPLVPSSFRRRSIVPNLQYYLSLYGSYENLLRALKFDDTLLAYSLETTVKPNIAILQECGLGDCGIAKLSICMPRMLTNNPERVREIVACAQGLGVPPGSPMFRHALHAVAFLNEDKIATKVDYLKKTFGWSDAEVRVAVCKAPMVLTRSKDMLLRKSEFLISEVGLEPAYIADLPVMISLSLEGRLRPRYYVVKFLKENGLLDCGRSYYSSLMPTEKVFLEKYIYPYKEVAPYLAEDYAAACSGEMPSRFRFT